MAATATSVAGSAALREPLLMAPHFSPRPWGGRLLERELGKPLPPEVAIGESWELSDHPSGRSRIADGPFEGEEFGALLRRFPREMIGRDLAPERYPLLVKILDAEEDLSIQVHPDDTYAIPRGDRGKTECWYIMDCASNGEVIFGLADGVKPNDLEQGAKDGSIEEMVARHPIHRGSFLFVEPGTVHALLGGTLVCEVQQSSDTTYRLWDWNRKPERELHIAQSIEVTSAQLSDAQRQQLPAAGELAEPVVLTDNAYFRVHAVDARGDGRTALPADLADSGIIIVCVEGSGVLMGPDWSRPVNRGQTLFVPAACGRQVSLSGNPVRVIVAESREL
jgi:mannose-6-phosphate isomerase